MEETELAKFQEPGGRGYNFVRSRLYQYASIAPDNQGPAGDQLGIIVDHASQPGAPLY